MNRNYTRAHNPQVTRPEIPTETTYLTWCPCGWEHESDQWFAAVNAKEQHTKNTTQNKTGGRDER